MTSETERTQARGGGIILEIASSSAEQTEEAGAKTAEAVLAEIKRTGSAFVALFGGLGAGKTAFMRGLARGLGFSGRVYSPTFSIVNEYQTPGGPDIYHFDMYRIEGEDDLYSTGFFEHIESGGVVVTEWSEKILPFIPPAHIEAAIERVSRGIQDGDNACCDDGRRKITVTLHSGEENHENSRA